MKINKSLKHLKQRILNISYKYKLSHIGSCLGEIEALFIIYGIMSEKDIFCLGNSHAFLALAVILEDVYGLDAECLSQKHGTHAGIDLENKIYCSGGSLGLVEPIAMGLAVYNPNLNIYLTSSDGGMAEGSIWEVLRYKADENLSNLKWYIVCNGWGAYRKINIDALEKRVHAFDSAVKIIRVNTDFDKNTGLAAHYSLLN